MTPNALEADRMFERHFDSYGVRIGLSADRRELLDALEQDQDVPAFGSVGAPLRTTRLMLRYRPLRASDRCLGCSTASFRVSAGTNLIADASNLTDAAQSLAAHAEFFVAEHAPNHLFVHAGVVGWKGHAIVMPGSSFAGKTTLVQAWLEAGATYYSDEFAVLDCAGRVHLFARPLAIRDGSTVGSRRVPVASLGAESGTTPMPIGLVLATSYRPGARWRPRRLTPALALLELMRHTVAARGNPTHSMPILKQAVSGVAFAGVRGEAPPLVSWVRNHVESPMSMEMSH